MLCRRHQQRLENRATPLELTNDRSHLDDFRPRADHHDDPVQHGCVYG
jgi:hypothetical protein